MTDAAGAYSLDNIPAGTYSVAAVAEGYLMSTAVGVTLSNGDTTQIPLTCTADATLALGAVAGVLTILGTAATPWAAPRSPSSTPWARPWPPPTPPPTASFCSTTWPTASTPFWPPLTAI